MDLVELERAESVEQRMAETQTGLPVDAEFPAGRAAERSVVPAVWYDRSGTSPLHRRLRRERELPLRMMGN